MTGTPDRPAGSAEGSIAFDPRVADYDRTRALPRGVAEELTTVLVDELGPQGPVVEVGVGTGRIALPLAAQGVRMIGVDLSPAMLERLRQNAGGVAAFPLVIADATRLPIRSASVGAALGVHVLHLIPAWRTAVAEMARIVRPGGTVVVDPGNPPTAEGLAFRDRFAELLGDAVDPVGLRHGGGDELDAAMTNLGLVRRDLPSVAYLEKETWADHLRKIRDGRLSWTWSVPREDLRRAVDEVWSWGEARFGDLDATRPVPQPIRLRAYDVSG